MKLRGANLVTLFDATKIVTGKVCPSCAREYSAGGNLTMCPHDKTLLSIVTADPFIGKVVAGYQIEEVLGAGGWSVVYRAKHTKIKRTVAIKVLHPHLVRDKDKVSRFQREAEAASALMHPSVAAVFDYGLLPEGQPFMVMEYLEGTALSDLIKEKGALPLDRALNMIKQALEGLEAAHEKGVIHRDIKPSNIFVSSSSKGDVVKILDFGLAKLLNPDEGQGNLTQTGETMGTPDYMSPEQCLGMQLDARSDLYSFGYVMYEMLTGKQPVMGKNAFESMHKHIYEMPPPLVQANPEAKVPDAVEAVVFKALAKKQADRYQSANELWEALEKASYREDKMPVVVRKTLSWLRRKRTYRSRGFMSELSPGNFVVPGLVAVLLLGISFKFVEALMHTGTRTVVSDVNPSTAWKSYFDQGTNRFNEGDYKSARKDFELADGFAKRLGEQSEQYSNTLNKLLAVYTKLNEPQLAANVQQRIKAVEDHYYWKLLGTKEGNTEKIVKLSEELVNNPTDKNIARELAETLNNQAALFDVDSSYDKALEMLERAQKIERKYLGESDTAYAMTLSRMASIKFHIGFKKEGLELAVEALKIRQKILPPNDPLMARSYRQLGDMCWRLGDYKRSEIAIRRSIDIYLHSAKDGPKSFNYAWSLNNLGVTLMSAGQLDEARKALNEALMIRREINGDDSVDVARSLVNLGLLDDKLHHPEAAVQQLKRAFDIFQKQLGTEAQDTSSTAVSVGEVYEHAGDHANAEKWLTRGFNSLLAMEPKGDATVRAFQLLVRLYQSEGRLEDARKLTARVTAAAAHR